MANPSETPEEIDLGINKKDHIFGMMNKLNQMRMQKRGCDLVIRVEGKEIPVHRNVMMVGSDFFDAMFTHDMEEKQSGVVEMKEMSFRIFNKCVDFMYTGYIALAEGECDELLFAAGLLQLSSVCKKIAWFLQSRLSPSSFFATKKIADKFLLVDLKEVCDNFAVENLDGIVNEKEFDCLEKEYISFLITAKKSIGCGDENSKMAIVLQWIKADIENRKEYLIDLATLVDFQKFSPGLVKHLALKEELCNESLQFMKMLVFASLTDSSVDCESPKVSFSSSKENALLVFDMSAQALRAFDRNSKKWTQMQTLHQDMETGGGNYTAVVLGDFIHVLFEDTKAYRLNFRKKSSQWEKIPNLKKNHQAPVATVYGGDIYVVGSNSMERYCASDTEWTEIDCTGIENCKCCSLAVHDHYIYSIGGLNAGTSMANVNKYSPSSMSWSSVKPMPRRSHLPAISVQAEKIFVAGGYDGGYLNDFLSFAPKTETWTQLPSMKNARYYFQLCFVSSQLYAVGNWESGCSIEKYDFEKERWDLVTDKDDDMKIMAPAALAIELPQS